MIGAVVRSALLACALGALGPERAARMERRLAGGRAMAARAQMARRALMALLFRRMKSARAAARPARPPFRR